MYRATIMYLNDFEGEQRASEARRILLVVTA